MSMQPSNVELDEFGLPKANPLPVQRSTDSFLEKCKKQPLVPAFSLATVGMLAYGLFSFKNNKPGASQRAMRLRVVAQGLTIAAMIGYLGVTGEGPLGEIAQAVREHQSNGK